MAYVFKDEVYQQLKELVASLLRKETPMSVLERTIVGTLLVHLVDEAKHILDIGLDEMLDKQIGDAIQGVLMNASSIFEGLLKSMTNEMGGIVMAQVNGVPWFFPDELAPEVCGAIPSFLNSKDKRGIVEQLDSHYQHGGGWRRQVGFRLNKKNWQLKYGEDPPLAPLGGAALHGEVVVIYQMAWVMVVSSENKFQVARMD